MADALASGDIGAAVRAYRSHPFHGRALPQSLLADWLHVSQSTLSRIERGERRLTVDEVARLARDLRLPWSLRWVPEEASVVSDDVDPFEPLEMMRRPARSEIAPGALEALYSAADQLCSVYSSAPAMTLSAHVEQQLRDVGQLLDGRKTFSQHRELLVTAVA